MPKSRSKSTAGQAAVGTPTHGASAIRAVSYSPNAAATSDPATMPTTGAQRPREPRAFSMMPATVARVVSAQSGPAAGQVPLGTLFNCSKSTGVTVTGTSMTIVPVTVGVSTLRNGASRAERANCRRAMASTRAARSAGPPASSAAMLTAMAAPGRAGDDEVARAEAAETQRLQDRDRARGRQRREHGPQHDFLGLAGAAEHDRGYQNGARQHHAGELKPESGGERPRNARFRAGFHVCPDGRAGRQVRHPAVARTGVPKGPAASPAGTATCVPPSGPSQYPRAPPVSPARSRPRA